ncbi:MAG TPA: CopD family protein [Verrucomicrobiae bacterium]|jgi:putative copper export protein
MIDEYLILARAVHFAVCLLFFGLSAFDRLVAASIFRSGRIEAADYWQSRLRLFNLVLLPLILISGIGWFILVAINMSGQPLQLSLLKTVWSQTQFGTISEIRLFAWIAAMVVGIAMFYFKSWEGLSKNIAWLQFLLGGLLLGSLAWVGHGQEDSRWHLGVDVLHLLMAGLWPTGLLPFAILLRRLRQAGGPIVVLFVRRFSALSLASVSLLALTGIINACYLVGSFSDLVEQPYGRWLLVKVSLFVIAVAIGAVNLFHLKPKLSATDSTTQTREMAVAQLQFNVQTELLLGIAIVIIVAVLGILPP